MSKHFNSKEAYSKQLVKNRLRNRYKRRIAREKLLKELKPEIDRVSGSDNLAELLTSQIKLD